LGWLGQVRLSDAHSLDRHLLEAGGELAELATVAARPAATVASVASGASMRSL
jgi:hypothetical protein